MSNYPYRSNPISFVSHRVQDENSSTELLLNPGIDPRREKHTVVRTISCGNGSKKQQNEAMLMGLGSPDPQHSSENTWAVLKCKHPRRAEYLDILSQSVSHTWILTLRLKPRRIFIDPVWRALPWQNDLVTYAVSSLALYFSQTKLDDRNSSR